MAAALDDTLDLLLDLQHDLGKYVRMPLSYLPANAPPDEVRAAVLRGLRETRKGPQGVRNARSLWESFLEEGGGALRGQPGFARLEEAVQRALAWESRAADPDAVIERGAAEADLDAVGAMIRELTRELRS